MQGKITKILHAGEAYSHSFQNTGLFKMILIAVMMVLTTCHTQYT